MRQIEKLQQSGAGSRCTLLDEAELTVTQVFLVIIILSFLFVGIL